MATTVYDTEEISLQDGTKVVLKPNRIKYQKQFMTLLEEGGSAQTNNEATDQLVALAAICLRGAIGDKADDTEWLEEALDEPTIYRIIEICGGIKLDDPNLMAAAAMVNQENQAEDGEN